MIMLLRKIFLLHKQHYLVSCYCLIISQINLIMISVRKFTHKKKRPLSGLFSSHNVLKCHISNMESTYASQMARLCFPISYRSIAKKSIHYMYLFALSNTITYHSSSQMIKKMVQNWYKTTNFGILKKRNPLQLQGFRTCHSLTDFIVGKSTANPLLFFTIFSFYYFSFCPPKSEFL